MPTYDYRCEACGHAFDLFQSIKADPIKICPECGADRARRVIGPGGGLIFKGSGFYITDYRSKDYKARAKADAPSSKPETKPEGKSSSGKGAGSGTSGSSAAA